MKREPQSLADGVSIRAEMRPGDASTLIRMHTDIYAREYGFDESFTAYVDRPLSDFARSPKPRERMWIAECAGRIVGIIAIVEGDGAQTQLRWFLVDPDFRGRGLGRRLLFDAVDFAVKCDYESIYLWTVNALAAAAKLYRAAGFIKVESKPGHWGVDVIEEKFVLDLSAIHPSRS